MFRKLHADKKIVTIFLNDRPMLVDAGDTVAAALLGAGVTRFRDSAVSASPRAPYCMMGVCFECLLEINGMPEQQACLTPVRNGMRVHTGEA
jgi:D-hydroxyproline dehydrogenase subunit gamma